LRYYTQTRRNKGAEVNQNHALDEQVNRTKKAKTFIRPSPNEIGLGIYNAILK